MSDGIIWMSCKLFLAMIQTMTLPRLTLRFSQSPLARFLSVEPRMQRFYDIQLPKNSVKHYISFYATLPCNTLPTIPCHDIAVEVTHLQPLTRLTSGLVTVHACKPPTIKCSAPLQHPMIMNKTGSPSSNRSAYTTAGATAAC